MTVLLSAFPLGPGEPPEWDEWWSSESESGPKAWWVVCAWEEV